MKEFFPAKRKIKGAAMKTAVYLSAGIVMSLLAVIIGFILIKGIPYITAELLTTKPSLLRDTKGILPNILNTVYIIFMTMMIVLPLGVGAAVYLTEYAKNARLIKITEFAVESLAGIPSIIYGLVGMLIFAEFFSFGTSLIAGAATLAIMTLPTVIRTTQESLKAVPRELREGALALGSGKWRMIRTIVLPSAIDGIVTGCILAAGRISGESAALFFTAGMANEALGFFEALSPGNAGATLAVSLYVYAKERGDFETAFAIAAVLLFLTLILNLAAKLFGKAVNYKRQRI